MIDIFHSDLNGMEIAKLSVLQIYTPIFSEGIAKQFLTETRELWFVVPGERKHCSWSSASSNILVQHRLPSSPVNNCIYTVYIWVVKFVIYEAKPHSFTSKHIYFKKNMVRHWRIIRFSRTIKIYKFCKLSWQFYTPLILWFLICWSMK